MEASYISEEMMSLIKNKYNEYFKINSNSDIWLQRSVELLEIYIPVLKYNILNKKIECSSVESLYKLIESYKYLVDLNIISIQEDLKFEKFLYYLPGFNFQLHKKYKKNNIKIEDLNTHMSTFENFGYIEMQIINFLKNNNIIFDIVLLEEKKRINEMLANF